MIVFILFVAAAIGIALPVHNVHPDFQYLVDEYTAIVNKECLPDQLFYPSKTSILFVKSFPEKDTAAQCTRFEDAWEIEVLQSEWDKITLDNRRTLIFHELSHCMLLQEHVENPMNYMYPSIVDIEFNVINDQVLEDAWNHCGVK